MRVDDFEEINLDALTPHKFKISSSFSEIQPAKDKKGLHLDDDLFSAYKPPKNEQSKIKMEKKVENKSSKPVKAAKCETLPKYNGSQNWDEWLRKFNLYAIKGRWTEEIKISTFIDYMSEDIQLLLCNLTSEQFDDFSKLELFDC